jgi:hypothetical protein
MIGRPAAQLAPTNSAAPAEDRARRDPWAQGYLSPSPAATCVAAASARINDEIVRNGQKI